MVIRWLMAACLAGAFAGARMRDLGLLGTFMRTFLGVAAGSAITPDMVGHLPDFALSLAFVPLFVLLIGGGLVGCPYYKVWERKMAGQAELQYQQGARQALIAQAAAEDEAAIKRAEAATRRVLGWTDAARRGCAELGRAGDRQCEEQLLKDAATYSIAKEGHEGVIISVGAPVSVAVDPLQVAAE